MNKSATTERFYAEPTAGTRGKPAALPPGHCRQRHDARFASAQGAYIGRGMHEYIPHSFVKDHVLLDIVTLICQCLPR